MSKLYVKAKSEKAEKGQGGNRDILTVFIAEIDGERQEVASVTMLVTDYGYRIGMRTPEGNEFVFKVSDKGNNEKGECTKHVMFTNNFCDNCGGTK